MHRAKREMYHHMRQREERRRVLPQTPNICETVHDALGPQQEAGQSPIKAPEVLQDLCENKAVPSRGEESGTRVHISS